MTRRVDVEEFVAQRTLAMVGVSRSGKGFGNSALKELRGKGYTMYPVHPEASAIQGLPAYPDLAGLPETPGGLLVIVPPDAAEQVVREAAAVGIQRVWLQQGSESPAAVSYCRENGITVVAGECVLMFAEPAALIHRFHRGLWQLLGKLPD